MQIRCARADRARHTATLSSCVGRIAMNSFATPIGVALTGDGAPQRKPRLSSPGRGNFHLSQNRTGE